MAPRTHHQLRELPLSQRQIRPRLARAPGPIDVDGCICGARLVVLAAVFPLPPIIMQKDRPRSKGLDAWIDALWRVWHCDAQCFDAVAVTVPSRTPAARRVMGHTRTCLNREVPASDMSKKSDMNPNQTTCARRTAHVHV